MVQKDTQVCFVLLDMPISAGMPPRIPAQNRIGPQAEFPSDSSASLSGSQTLWAFPIEGQDVQPETPS